MTKKSYRKKCKICSAEFFLYRGQGLKKYCCVECRKVAKSRDQRKSYVKKHGIKLCSYCHVVLEGNRSKFCTNECMSRNYRLKRVFIRYRSEMKKRNCIRKRAREDKDKIRKYRQRWREKNRDKLRLYYREYYRKSNKFIKENTQQLLVARR